MSSITWTANDGVGIKAGEFQQFLVSVGLPDATAVAFEGGPEPDHPAPTVTLTNADETSAPAVESAATNDDSDSAKTIAVVGLVVAVIALIAAVVSLVSRKRTTA